MLATLAGLAVSTLATSATLVPAPVSGDLYLGFRASGGDGGSTSFIVKLGQDTVFRNSPPGSSFTVSGLGDIASDLVATYGSNWATRSDLFWGVFGVRSSANSILYGSKERSPVTTVASAWSALDSTARNSTASQITSVLESIGGYRGRDATANSPVATFQPNSADASSYYKQVASAGTTDFGSLSGWNSIEGTFASGVSGTALDLFRIAASGVSRVGTFTITNAGTVHFAAPPPAAPVDSDGDGVLDSDEALAGTNPNDATDFFHIQALVKSPTSVGVSFNTIPARTYLIYYTEDLTTGSWQLIDTLAGGASPTTLQYHDTDPVRKSRPKGFYKVAVTQ